jgi:hypothetical protein
MATVRQIFIFIWIVFASGAIANATTPYSECTDLLSIQKNTQMDLSAVHQELMMDVFDPERAMSELQTSAEGMVVEDFLGAGVDSFALKIRRNNRLYALKIHIATDPYEVAPTVSIQNHLAQVGLAPLVFGVLSANEIQKLERSYPEIFNRGFLTAEDKLTFGVLMDLTSSTFLKSIARDLNPEKIKVTSAQKESLLLQARQHMAVLKKLNIYPEDIDAVIDTKGRLLLVDFGFYSYALPGSSKAQQLHRRVDMALEDLKSFINRATELTQ